MNKQRLKFLIIAAVIIVFGVALDQYSKWLCVQHLPYETPVECIPHILNLTYITNDGAAWGMLDEHRWVFMSLSTVAIIGMLIFLFTLKEKSETFLAVSLAVIISGGIGNMIDRVMLETVVDFIDFNPFLSYLHLSFPIFNIADTLVCIGGGMLVLAYILLWRKEEQEKKEKKAE